MNPKRILHNVRLRDQKRVAQSLWFARSNDGACLHDNQIYRGYVTYWTNRKGEPCYKAVAWNQAFTIKLSRLLPTMAKAERRMITLGVGLQA